MLPKNLKLIFLSELNFGKMTMPFFLKKKNRYRHVKESHYAFLFYFQRTQIYKNLYFCIY